MRFNKKVRADSVSYCCHASLNDFYKADRSLGFVLKRQKVSPFYGIPQNCHCSSFILTLILSLPLPAPLPPSLPFALACPLSSLFSFFYFSPPSSQLSLCISKHTPEKIHFPGWPVIFPTVTLFPPSSVLCLWQAF